MGFLTTFTVHNDDCDQITKHPEEFANEIYAACGHTYKRNNYVFRGVVIAQRSRHADDKTVYVHAGNTVCEMNAYSAETLELMRRNPKFFKEMLVEMEMQVKELKKKFKESQK